MAKYMEKDLYTTKPRYNEHILPVPWPLVISRFHCTLYTVLNFGYCRLRWKGEGELGWGASGDGSVIFHGCSGNIVSFLDFHHWWRPQTKLFRGNIIQLGSIKSAWRELRLPLVAFSCDFSETFLCWPGIRAWSPSVPSSCAGYAVCSDETGRLLIASHETLPEWSTQNNSQVSQGKQNLSKKITAKLAMKELRHACIGCWVFNIRSGKMTLMLVNWRRLIWSLGSLTFKMTLF